MRYPWPDTVALILTFLLSALVFVAGSIANVKNLSGPWALEFGEAWLKLFGMVVVPIWLTCHGIDWLFMGPEKRAPFTLRPPRE